MMTSIISPEGEETGGRIEWADIHPFTVEEEFHLAGPIPEQD